MNTVADGLLLDGTEVDLCHLLQFNIHKITMNRFTCAQQ